MMAAEFVAAGAWEMFWFHGLSAGKRFELSKEAEASVGENSKIQVATNAIRTNRLQVGRGFLTAPVKMV